MKSSDKNKSINFIREVPETSEFVLRKSRGGIENDSQIDFHSFIVNEDPRSYKEAITSSDAIF